MNQSQSQPPESIDLPRFPQHYEGLIPIRGTQLIRHAGDATPHNHQPYRSTTNAQEINTDTTVSSCKLPSTSTVRTLPGTPDPERDRRQSRELWANHQTTPNYRSMDSWLSTPFIIPSLNQQKDSDKYRTVWSFDRTEREIISMKVRNLQELRAFKERLAREHRIAVCDRNRDSSLSSQSNTKEGAAAKKLDNEAMHTVPSDEELEGMIRNFSPGHSPAEIVPYILGWIESKKKDLDKTEDMSGSGSCARTPTRKIDKMWKAKEFNQMKIILLEEFGNIWLLKEAEEPGKRFLTKAEYEEASDRLRDGYSLTDTTAKILLDTVKGLDSIKLFALLLKHDCVVSSDITLMGMSLAESFLKDGFGFALHEMFETAGDKLCRGRAEEFACTAVDTATRLLYTNAHTRENLEILKSLCDMVDRYGRAQREKYRGSERHPRKGFVRQVDERSLFQVR